MFSRLDSTGCKGGDIAGAIGVCACRGRGGVKGQGRALAEGPLRVRAEEPGPVPDRLLSEALLRYPEAAPVRDL